MTNLHEPDENNSDNKPHVLSSPPESLSGQTVLVTGGAGGIGAALAQRFTQRGARVVVADIDPAGQHVADAIGAVYIQADVTDLAANQAAVQASSEHFGSLDIAVLNAGIGERGSYVDDFDPNHYRQLVAVNLDGVVFGIQAALQHFIAQSSGAILATASLAGIVESSINPLYAATKHAVVGLIRSVAPAVQDRGITLNALCPTFVDTPILQGFVPQIRDAGVAVLEPARVADVAEIALASGLTGQIWPVLPHGETTPWPFAEAPHILTDPDQSHREMPS